MVEVVVEEGVVMGEEEVKEEELVDMVGVGEAEEDMVLEVVEEVVMGEEQGVHQEDQEVVMVEEVEDMVERVAEADMVEEEVRVDMEQVVE